MSVYHLHNQLNFPNPAHAGKDGLLAIGGDLSSHRLIEAYRSGVFPWFNPGDPIMWWSPDPRCVLNTSKVKISASMRNVMNRQVYEVRMDEQFEMVMRRCISMKRKQRGTWIGDEMIRAYVDLHHQGLAHSVEVYCAGELVGGLYGVSLGRMFFGESMFSHSSNSSKFALIMLCKALETKGVRWIDCQMYTEHLASMGAELMSRQSFLELLSDHLSEAGLTGKWGWEREQLTIHSSGHA